MMKNIKLIPIRLLSLAFVMACPAWAAQTEALNFKEVYDLLRTNLVGVTESELNRAAAQGLIDELQPRVLLITNDSASASATGSVLRTTVYDGAYAYVRLGQIQAGTDQQLRSAYRNLSSSNRLKGLILDLRFADGQDYSAAAAVADMFFSTEQPLVDYGQGLKKSTVKTNALTLPLALLVNRKTAGAAEAVVGTLRQADIGVAIGSPTAGLAALSKEFTLKTGQRVQVALAPIKVGKGQELPLTGFKPDILVQASLQDEAAYLQDPYRESSKPASLARSSPSSGRPMAGTNQIPSHRLNEAELVRMLREGETFDLESNATLKGVETVRPTIQDPALQRGLDLLKGLAVLRQVRRL